MPKYGVTLYNSVSGNIHSRHEVEGVNTAEAIHRAQQESDEQHGYNDVVRPAYRASVVQLADDEVAAAEAEPVENEPVEDEE